MFSRFSKVPPQINLVELNSPIILLVLKIHYCAHLTPMINVYFKTVLKEESDSLNLL